MTEQHQTRALLLERTSRALNTLSRRKALLILVLLVIAAYSSLSILRHRHFMSGAYDLAIFDQAVWQYSRFRPPINTVRSNLLTENLLGDHFHPILALLGPVFWIRDSVEALLIAQAVLFAVAIIPIFLFTEKRLGKFPAYVFAIAYAIFWGTQRAVEFDFHEIAFAVPLIALAIYFIDERRWQAYFVCMVLLLLTKENMSVLVFFFGIYLLALKQVKQGLISIAAGLVWFFVSIKILIPFFVEPTIAAGERRYYRYWNYSQFGTGPGSAFVTIVKNPLLLIETFVSPAEKLRTYWNTFHPFLFLPFLSPLLILAIPLIAERFLSNNPNLWTVHYHYTATIVPVLVMASADALARISGKLNPRNRQYVVIAAACLVLFLNVRTLPQTPLWVLTKPQHWQLTASDMAGKRALALVPSDASVSVQAPIASHLSHRPRIFVLHPHVRVPDSDFVIISRQLNPFPYANYNELKLYVDSEEARGYRKIFAEEGWEVFKAESITGAPKPLFVDAVFVEQSAPDVMTAGQKYPVSITFKNTGIKTWSTADQFRLAYLSGTKDWNLERVELPRSASPGEVVTFDFTVVAPMQEGSYSFHWGMIQEGVAAFGQPAPQVWVSVTAGSPSR